MKDINKNKLREIEGGVLNVTGALVESVVSLIKTVFNLGRSLGGSFKKISQNNYCN
jgi:hypothetical protein